MKIYSNGKMIEASGCGNANEVYSTEEQRIGTWFGEPLYQIGVKTSSPSSLRTWVQIYPPIDGLDKVISINAIIEAFDGRFDLVNWTSEFLICYAKSQNIGGIGPTGLCLWCTREPNRPMAVIIKYTKTTDSAPETAAMLEDAPADKLTFRMESLASMPAAVSAMPVTFSGEFEAETEEV